MAKLKVVFEFKKDLDAYRQYEKFRDRLGEEVEGSSILGVELNMDASIEDTIEEYEDD